jgi:hypothetical protein
VHHQVWNADDLRLLNGLEGLEGRVWGLQAYTTSDGQGARVVGGDSGGKLKVRDLADQTIGWSPQRISSCPTMKMLHYTPSTVAKVLKALPSR